ncbi:MAG: alanyl-tRNA editing protein [Gemmatimonadota bacterium]
MTTERLYYTDSYLSRFAARVIDRADGGRRVYLDRTAFYPTSGGQPFDTGRLGGVRVVEVVDEEARVAHLLEAPLAEGPVEGEVDWGRRFDHMQQHTGQHLLSAVVADLFGYQTVSVHFGPESATLDLEVPAITPKQVREAEARANAVVTENRTISVRFEDAATATGLRKASDRTGVLRVVTITDLDRSACGGTHVRATGEIGPILIRRIERVKKLVRLEFLCGGRAVRRARADFDALAGVATEASTGIDDIPALFEKQRTELKQTESARRGLEEELNGYRARALYDAAPANVGGSRLVVHRSAAGGVESLRGLAAAVTALPGAVFIGTLATPPTILFAIAADGGPDAGATLKPILAELGGRGGGQARQAQGTVPGGAELEAAIARLATAVGAEPLP